MKKIFLFFCFLGIFFQSYAQKTIRKVTYELEGGKAVLSLISNKSLRDFKKLDPKKDQKVSLTLKVEWLHSAKVKYILLRPAHVSIKVGGKKKGKIKVLYEKFKISTPLQINFYAPFSKQKGEIVIDPHYLLNTENINAGKRAKGKVMTIPFQFTKNTKKDKTKKEDEEEQRKEDSLEIAIKDSLRRNQILHISTYSITPSGAGTENGMIELDIMGGKPPYFYKVKSLDLADTLHPEDSRIILDELEAGVYSIEIYDSKGTKIIFEKEVKSVGTPPEKEENIIQNSEKNAWKIWISVLWLLLLIITPIYVYRKKIKEFVEKTKVNTAKKNTNSKNTKKKNFLLDKIKIRKGS